MTETTSTADIGGIITRNVARFTIDGVLSIRPGFALVDGWLTDTRAIVVTVESGFAETDRLPDALEGVPVDVRVASPAKRLQLVDADAYTEAHGPDPDSGAVPEFSDELAVVGGEPLAVRASSSRAAVAQAGKPELPYAPPVGASLGPVSGTITVDLSASPDSAWPTLSAFLTGTATTLTVGLYDFTSAHVLKTVSSVLEGRTVKLVLDHPSRNPTADQTDEQTVTALTAAFGDHLTQAWALERSDPKATAWIFPSAYHIKVAVRDSTSVWLSSGNWNNSNQPDIDPVHVPGDATAARSGDRDWHVVVHDPGLAATFEAYLLNDLAVAQQHNAAADAGPVPAALLLPNAQTPPFASFSAAATVTAPMTITPVLTPDLGGYGPVVRALIDGATTSLHMQFQYIELPKPAVGAATAAPSVGLHELVDAVIARQKAGVDVKIIMSEFETAGYLEQLQGAGLDVVHSVRLQNNVHNKGIVVDGRAVLVSSQNWSTAGTSRNRDAGVVIENVDVAAYFDTLFLHDWQNLAAAQTASD